MTWVFFCQLNLFRKVRTGNESFSQNLKWGGKIKRDLDVIMTPSIFFSLPHNADLIWTREVVILINYSLERNANFRHIKLVVH